MGQPPPQPPLPLRWGEGEQEGKESNGNRYASPYVLPLSPTEWERGLGGRAHR